MGPGDEEVRGESGPGPKTKDANRAEDERKSAGLWVSFKGHGETHLAGAAIPLKLQLDCSVTVLLAMTTAGNPAAPLSTAGLTYVGATGTL